MSAPLKALERPPFSMVTLSSPFASRYSPRVAPRPMASNRAFVSLMSPFELPRRPCAGGDFFDLTLMDKMTDTLTVKMPPDDVESLTVPLQAEAPRARISWRDLEIVPDEKPLRAAPRRARPDPEPCALWEFVAIGCILGTAAVAVLAGVGFVLGAWS